MMSRTAFQQSLRNLLDQKPFKPFVIESDDGRRWQIDRKEYLSYYLGDNAMYLGPGDMEFVDCEIVREIVELDGGANSSKN